MTLKEYYESIKHRPATPKQVLRKKLIDAFGVTEQSVYRWLSGEVIPEKERWAEFEKIIGIPASELFAKKTESL